MTDTTTGSTARMVIIVLLVASAACFAVYFCTDVFHSKDDPDNAQSGLNTFLRSVFAAFTGGPFFIQGTAQLFFVWLANPLYFFGVLGLFTTIRNWDEEERLSTPIVPTIVFATLAMIIGTFPMFASGEVVLLAGYYLWLTGFVVLFAAALVGLVALIVVSKDAADSESRDEQST